MERAKKVVEAGVRSMNPLRPLICSQESTLQTFWALTHRIRKWEWGVKTCLTPCLLLTEMTQTTPMPPKRRSKIYSIWERRKGLCPETQTIPIKPKEYWNPQVNEVSSIPETKAQVQKASLQDDSKATNPTRATMWLPRGRFQPTCTLLSCPRRTEWLRFNS